jgi:hypothetical protein
MVFILDASLWIQSFHIRLQMLFQGRDLGATLFGNFLEFVQPDKLVNIFRRSLIFALITTQWAIHQAHRFLLGTTIIVDSFSLVLWFKHLGRALLLLPLTPIVLSTVRKNAIPYHFV